jgi:hypothetical protein
MSELINYNPDLIQPKIGIRESFESKCTVGSMEFRTPISMSLKKKLSSLSFIVIIINHDMTYVIMTDVSPKLLRKCCQHLILIKLR